MIGSPSFGPPERAGEGPDHAERADGALLVALLVAGIALRLAVALQPIERLVTINVPDDAFYYFQIAAGHAQGRGFSPAVTGPTTGFHPLWGALLAAGARLVEHDGIPRMALLLGALTDSVTMLLILRLLLRCAGPARAGAGLALYALSAPAILQCTNGVETGVNILAWTLLLGVLSEGMACRGGLAGRSWAWLAAACALALLARTDNVFIVAAVCGLALATTPRAQWLGRALPGAAVGLLALSPWLLRCWWTDGTILQSSASAKPMVLHAHRLGLALSGPLGALRALQLFGGLILRQAEGQILALAVLALCLAWIHSRRAARGPSPDGGQAPPADAAESLATALGLVTLAYLAMLAFHAIARLYIQQWYLGPANLLLALSLALLCPAAPPRWLPRAMAVVLLVLSIVATPPVGHWSPGALGDQANLLDAARFARDRLAGERVGAFNSGILGFVASGQGVNLDGVVNRGALDALKARALLAYVRGQGIRYVLDNATDVEDIYGAYWGVSDLGSVLRVRQTFQWQGEGLNARIHLYEVMP